MKKISLYAASLVVLGVGFTACNEINNDMRLEPPTTYTLETPSDVDQLIKFGEEVSNVNNEWEVVTYNPYNITPAAYFQVQVAKSEDDFLTWDNLVSDNGGDEKGDYTDSEGLPYAAFVNATYTSTSFAVPGGTLCDAINSVYGLENEEQIEAMGPVQVAYRVHAWIPNVEYSSIYSNIVVLKEVQSYIPLTEPRKIYVIGEPQGWNINSDEIYIKETGIGSNIYTGSINVAEGAFMFRFYSELGNWEANSIGSQVEDNPIEIEVTDNSYLGDVVVGGKGSWSYPSWEGGAVDIELDLNDNTVTFTLKPGEEAAPVPTGKVLYLVGQPQGWKIDSDSMWIQETEEGSNIYEGTLEIASGQFQFRFYSELGDWDKYSIGAQNEDNPVNIEFTDDVYSGPVVAYDEAAGILGKGAWQDSSWTGGHIKVSVDLNEYTITMTIVDNETSTEPEPVDNSIYIRGGMNDWGTDANYKFEEVSDSEWVIENVTIASGIEFKVADANWGAVNLGGPGEEDGVVVPIGSDFELVSNGKNLVLNQDFTGTMTLTLDNGTYTLLLTAN